VLAAYRTTPEWRATGGLSFFKKVIEVEEVMKGDYWNSIEFQSTIPHSRFHILFLLDFRL